MVAIDQPPDAQWGGFDSLTYSQGEDQPPVPNWGGFDSLGYEQDPGSLGFAPQGPPVLDLAVPVTEVLDNASRLQLEPAVRQRHIKHASTEKILFYKHTGAMMVLQGMYVFLN